MSAAKPAAAVPRRLRRLFRFAFVLLLAATLGLALDVLHDEKERSHRSYAEGLRKSEAQIAARLAHPTGQLMLLNAAAADLPATPLVPLVLPFGAIDFDDRGKAQQAVELAGCGVAYGDGAALCAGIGSNPFAGAFVYVVGQLPAAALVPHPSGQLDLSVAHRAWVEVRLGSGESWRWIAPFQAQGDTAGAANGLQHGRLVAFDADAELTTDSRPLRDVRGWMWQEGECLAARPPATPTAAAVAAVAAPDMAPTADCPRRTYISLRLPVAAWREALDARGAAAWPPPALAATQVRLQLLGPGEGNVLFDSDNPARGSHAAASAPFALAEFRRLLLPGETLRVQRDGQDGVVLEARGETAAEEPALPWIDALIRWLPVAGYDMPVESRSTIATRLGNYQLTLLGDLRTVNRQLASGATRLAGYVGAMLAAVLLVWLLLEAVVMRRIAVLTRRAAAVSEGMRLAAAAAGAGSAAAAPRPELTLDVKDLRGGDELGVLAQGLHDLLERVHADVEREQIRTRQERDQWHAVGHEIVSPLQSLIALHGDPADPAARYLRRMQQAVRVLYGQASPSEAFESTQLALAPLDLDAFAASVAGNARHVGIEAVVYVSAGQPLPVRADEHSLEDVVTHVLRNAQRHRRPGTPITLTAETGPREVRLHVHNEGEPIALALLPRIFDYGVSGAPATGDSDTDGEREGTGAPAPEGDAWPAGEAARTPGPGNDSSRRGQGLFVARTYMAKMGGTIVAANVPGGVRFTLALPRADAPAGT